MKPRGCAVVELLMDVFSSLSSVVVTSLFINNRAATGKCACDNARALVEANNIGATWLA